MIFYFCQITVRYCTLSPKKWWGRIEHKIQITGRKIVCTYVGICCQDARTVLYCTSSSKWTVQYRYRYLSSDQIGRSYFLFSNKNIIIVNCLFTKKKRKEKRLFINMTMLQEWYAVWYGTVPLPVDRVSNCMKKNYRWKWPFDILKWQINGRWISSL